MQLTKIKIVKLFPLFLFTVLFISPFFAWKIAQNVVKAEVRRSYDKEVQIVEKWMQDRLDLYLTVAHGMRIFFESSDKATQSEWSTYIQKMKMLDQYPAISSLAYIERVEGKDGDAYIVKYMEPLGAVDEAKETVGSNINLDPKRTELFNSVRDEDSISTQRFALTTAPRKGFEIIMPVYRKGFTPTTIEERRAALKGFVLIEFAGSRLFQDLFNIDDSTNLSFEIYSGLPSEETLVYDQDLDYSAVNPNYQPEITTSGTFEFNNQTWYLMVATKPDFKLTPFQKKLPLIVLASGLVFSFLFLGIYIYAQRRDRTLPRLINK